VCGADQGRCDRKTQFQEKGAFFLLCVLSFSVSPFLPHTHHHHRPPFLTAEPEESVAISISPFLMCVFYRRFPRARSCVPFVGGASTTSAPVCACCVQLHSSQFTRARVWASLSLRSWFSVRVFFFIWLRTCCRECPLIIPHSLYFSYSLSLSSAPCRRTKREGRGARPYYPVYKTKCQGIFEHSPH